MPLRAVTETDQASAPDLEEKLRAAMVACREAADAIYESRNRDMRDLERSLDLEADLLERRLKRMS